MSRNRGQNKQGKKGEEKVVIRRKGKYSEATRKANRERNLLTATKRAQKKLRKLMARGAAGKPGGIMPASYRHEKLYTHINNLNQQAKFPSKFSFWL